MTVARITMVEYMSEQVADKFEDEYKIVCPKALPEANAHILIRTGPSSGMSVAIYKDEETAERLLEARQRMLDGFPNVFKDHWHLQGEVSLHYINSLTKNAKRE